MDACGFLHAEPCTIAVYRKRNGDEGFKALCHAEPHITQKRADFVGFCQVEPCTFIVYRNGGYRFLS